jgi:hypothetical protein
MKRLGFWVPFYWHSSSHYHSVQRQTLRTHFTDMLETIIHIADWSVHYYKMTTGKSKTSTGDKMSRLCRQADSTSSVRWHKEKRCVHVCCQNIVLIQQFCDSARQKICFSCFSVLLPPSGSSSLGGLECFAWTARSCRWEQHKFSWLFHLTRHNRLHLQWESRSESST